MTRIYIILCFITLQSYSQNIFPIKYESCSDSLFSMENDSILTRTDVSLLIKTIFYTQDDRLKERLEGTLSLQILVDLNGTPCLISLENKTNVNEKKLNIKNLIDTNTKWSKPYKKVCAVISLEIKNGVVHYSRWGLNGNTGWHELFE